ncbi:AI-2E family transporter [Phenylobacterium sp. J367]|uniref:AI-2E family transporter n=1 Tax=Phenylobacterium sp. J367 TaxID=2898435 RepID=UPI002151195F|nr:AI-2E family transporter [Phenylobacterium sp. J367]MCR5878072.1 AI-2E family transporter [Phenylobacterium sp. J367]
MPVRATESPLIRVSLAILAVIATGAALKWLSGILTPLALAVFLAVMIDGFGRVLHHRLPLVTKRAALPLAVVISILLFGGAAYVVAENARSFAGQLGGYEARLDGLLARFAAMAGMQVPPTVDQLIEELNPTRFLGIVARSLQNFTATAGFVLVYLGFIIASRHGWERKVVNLFPHREERQEAMATFLRIRDGVEQYLWVQTVTGLMICAVSYVAMVAVGLENAVFWTFLIFITTYIPVIGGIIGVAVPPIMALVQFETLWQAIVLFAVLQTVTLVVGNVIYPRMQGRSLNVDPVVVLLSLAFWTAIWGVTGAFLSTPLTVMAMVILAQFPSSRWIAILLSEDGDPLRARHEKHPPKALDHAIAAEEPAKRRKRSERT